MKDAPFAKPLMAGAAEPELVPVTLTVTEAVRLLAELSVYTAVMTGEPCGNCDPVTARVAVAEPAAPTRRDATGVGSGRNQVDNVGGRERIEISQKRDAGFRCWCDDGYGVPACD